MKPPQHRLHPGQEFGGVEGFDDVVLRPGVKAPDPVGHRAPGGDEDHRQVQGLAVFQQGKPVAPGEHDVHQGQVVDPSPGQVGGPVPVWGPVTAIAGPFQGHADEVGNGALVLGDENVWHQDSSLSKQPKDTTKVHRNGNEGQKEPEGDALRFA